MKHVIDIPRTAMEVFNMLPEGTRCEVIDNTLYMSPSPNYDHQDLLGDIFVMLKEATTKNQWGKVFIAPFDVYLSGEADVVQPDLIFVKDQHNSIIQKNGIHGVPDLVIELLSSNKSYDTKKKFDLYQRNLIPEYIIIDPETKEVWQYLLGEDGRYEQIASEKGRLVVSALNAQFSF
ncbi:Uma2 family endonuclease [Mucilaginibacter paludis]|uniref:Putative restriction endonuclease domain-containing protein n=1 Tax=Mucilaginibacter paludis DSM 18603 TaxID=714943 RepID=H1YGK1_9SPHI|nr:Uma2 family endonuclease [Mucilaginibacter paludis]EHQ25387.1 protein of unknown function DUF820 [Mucilaginibacter paludis DSM 18603]